MKILSKKQYGVLVDKIKELEEEKEKIKKKYDNKDFEYLGKYSTEKDKCIQLEKTNEEHLKLNGELRKENDDLKETIKELRGAKGGLTKQVNKLTKELEEANALIEEQKKELSKRYIIKKVRATKPKKQTMNLKSSSKQSNAIKLVKEKL